MIIRLDEQLDKTSVHFPGLKNPDDSLAMVNALSILPGIINVDWRKADEQLEFHYNPVLISQEEIQSILAEMGYESQQENNQESLQISILRLEGLDCADCAFKLEKRIKLLPGVQEVQVNYGAAKMQVKHSNPLPDIVQAARTMGYQAYSDTDPAALSQHAPFWIANKYAFSSAASAIFLLIAVVMQFLEAPWLYTQIAYILGILTGAYLPARTGFAVLWGARELDMNILMTLAACGAIAIGQVQEGAVVVFLFALGNALQTYTMDKTRKSIRSLMELGPDQALVRRNGEESLIPTQEILIGDMVIVRPGERIPMDGMVASGSTAVDQSPITGESVPIDKIPGDRVFAGTLNTFGSIEFTVDKKVSDTTLQRIIHMVEEAQGKRAPSQQIVDRFARYYTPGVVIAAALVAFIPPLIFDQAFHHWFYQALGMLLVACPCALIISTPVSIVSAIGNAARNGVLIKGGAYLEESGQLSVMVFDKTGTLTLGQPQVSQVYSLQPNGEKALVSAAAAIESRSEHPLARCIVEYSRRQGLTFAPADNFQAIGGLGARGDVEGLSYLIGSPRLISEQGYRLDNLWDHIEKYEEQGNTIVLLASPENVLGIIAITDQLRPHVAEALQTLKSSGIRRTVMLTGDNPAAAAAIAREAGVDEFQASLLPEDKVEAIQNLISRFGKVAMVGDGINDAPALAASSLGIAMGVAGTDAALETADITLMSDDLSKLAFTIHLGRRTLRIIKQNLAFSLLFKAAILMLVIPGWLTLWLAVFGDMGTSLLVTLNGMRLLNVKNTE